MGVSILITAYKEPRTVAHALEALRRDEGYIQEILLICPDEETRTAGFQVKGWEEKLRWIQDEGKGKPSALNKAIKEMKGDIAVCTDGDVWVEPGSIGPLLMPLAEEEVGAVTGRPITGDDRKTVYGFWAHFLTDYGAHETRKKRERAKQYIAASGYLLAIRKKDFPMLPVDILSDDAYISAVLWQSGKRVAYAEEAKVWVKYPNNWHDWMLQKKRSAGGYIQLQKYVKVKDEMRSLKREVLDGVKGVLSYPKSIKEYGYMLLLCVARVLLWLSIFWEVKLLKKGGKDLWKRVESTK